MSLTERVWSYIEIAIILCIALLSIWSEFEFLLGLTSHRASPPPAVYVCLLAIIGVEVVRLRLLIFKDRYNKD